jgi:hypothetical protein
MIFHFGIDMKDLSSDLKKIRENVHKLALHSSSTSQNILFDFNGFLVVHKHITIYNFKIQGLPFIYKHFIFESSILNLDHVLFY